MPKKDVSESWQKYPMLCQICLKKRQSCLQIMDRDLEPDISAALGGY
jgi:hypothetical protein